MKRIVNALARFFCSKPFALLCALMLLAAGVVLLITGSFGLALAAGYLGALLFILVWNHCAAELNRRSGRDTDDGR